MELLSPPIELAGLGLALLTWTLAGLRKDLPRPALWLLTGIAVAMILGAIVLLFVSAGEKPKQTLPAPPVRIAPVKPVVLSAVRPKPVPPAAKPPQRVARVAPPAKSATPALDPLLVDCQNGFMPTLTIGPNDRVNMLYVYPRNPNMSRQFLIKGGDFTVTNPDETPKSAWTCKVRNYNRFTLLNVKLALGMKWWKTIKDGNTLHQSVADTDPATTPAALITLDTVDPAPSPFVFYILNHGDELVDISIPPIALGTRLDTNETVQVPVRTIQSVMEVWPAP